MKRRSHIDNLFLNRTNTIKRTRHNRSTTDNNRRSIKIPIMTTNRLSSRIATNRAADSPSHTRHNLNTKISRTRLVRQVSPFSSRFNRFRLIKVQHTRARSNHNNPLHYFSGYKIHITRRHQAPLARRVSMNITISVYNMKALAQNRRSQVASSYPRYPSQKVSTTKNSLLNTFRPPNQNTTVRSPVITQKSSRYTQYPRIINQPQRSSPPRSTTAKAARAQQRLVAASNQRDPSHLPDINPNDSS